MADLKTLGARAYIRQHFDSALSDRATDELIHLLRYGFPESPEVREFARWVFGDNTQRTVDLLLRLWREVNDLYWCIELGVVGLRGFVEDCGHADNWYCGVAQGAEVLYAAPVNTQCLWQPNFMQHGLQAGPLGFRAGTWQVSTWIAEHVAAVWAGRMLAAAL